MKENKPVSSIAKKLNWLGIRKIFVSFITIDLAILIIAIFFWCYYSEISSLDSFSIFTNRSMEIKNNTIYYIITDSKEMTKAINASPFISTVKVAAITVGIIEVLVLFNNILFGTRRIRRNLKPLHDIAQKAESLSSFVFNEKKYQTLEDAISKLSPSSPDAMIHTDDKDLQGIEIALNNLLERMRASYIQQSRFVSDASHELRTPIAVIKGYVDMLDRWGKNDVTILDESIQAIKHESNHMNKLVEQLLFLARGDSGSNKMTFEDFSLTEMMKAVYEESTMIDTKHKYEYIAKEDIIVNGDMDMLKQTARILVDNAAKYTKEDDEITINTGTDVNGNVFFSVQDNGIGMHEADIGNIFERFYRADPARNNYTGGTGLGLSIAKWIVDKHKGYFDILSRRDIGTRITVFIPKQ